MNTWRAPYEAHTSVEGFASEDSALPKHLEEPRLRAETHFGVQALNLAWYRAGTGFSPWGPHTNNMNYEKQFNWLACLTRWGKSINIF